MRLLVLALVFASAAAAQTPDTTAAPPQRPFPRAGRALVGVLASVGTPVALYYLAGEEAAVAGAIAFPLVAAVAVHEAGPGEGADFGRTLGGALIGAAAGVVVLAAGGAVSASGVCGELCFAPLLPGVAVLVLGPSIGAAIRYRPGTSLQPVVLVRPGGNRTAGLALRVAL